jgi:translocator protein
MNQPKRPGELAKRYGLLGLFIVVVMFAGALVGTQAGPGAWYLTLKKPSFNPPSWVFGPVWTLLYAMIAVAGFRTYCRDAKSSAFRLWCLQMLLNLAWSPTFFRAQAPGVALVVIVAMLSAIVAFVVHTWRRDRTSALVFIPYAAWVSFATVLNAALFWLNR